MDLASGPLVSFACASGEGCPGNVTSGWTPLESRMWRHWMTTFIFIFGLFNVPYFVCILSFKQCAHIVFKLKFYGLQYSRTPLKRPPSESHWCGRIRGMVAREGFVYKQKPLSVTRNVVVSEGWSLVRVVVRQGFYCTVLFS